VWNQPNRAQINNKQIQARTKRKAVDNGRGWGCHQTQREITLTQQQNNKTRKNTEHAHTNLHCTYLAPTEVGFHGARMINGTLPESTTTKHNKYTTPT
jgi:hypothetical protein